MKALKALFYDPLESKGGLLAIVILISLCMLSFCFGRISAGDLNVITTTYVVMWTLMFTLSVDAALAIFDRLTSGWYRDNILHPEAVEFKSFADHPITRPLTNVKRMVLIFVSLALVIAAGALMETYKTTLFSSFAVCPLFVLLAYAVAGISDLLMRFLAIMPIWKKKHQKA